jgi:glycosyltransferase involved in cell wall biosynthesis
MPFKTKLRNKPAEILMSSGGGRLHFAEAASALLEHGADLSLIIGVKPPTYGRQWINLAGRFFGQRDLFRRLQLRTVGGRIPAAALIGCALAEINIHVLYRLADFRLVPRGFTQALAWRMFGWASARHLKIGGKVFHVRSGAGQGGAIAKAKKMGYSVIVDHSIAHPEFIAEILDPILGNFGKDELENYRTMFWGVVLDDCHEGDVILVNSDFVRETFIARGFPAERLRVIYLGVRNDFIGCKKQYTAGQPLRLLHTGSFTLRKGAHDIMAALAELDRRGLNYELTVAGGADNGPILQKRFGVKGHVVYKGQLPQYQLRSLFMENDIFLFPSLAEGSSKAAMEAMGAGIPVITTPNTGLPLIHGEDGWLVQAGDFHALAAGIERLAADDQLRERLGSTASVKINSHYQWRHYAERLSALYLELISA